MEPLPYILMYTISMKNEIKELVDDIRTHLEYQKMMGITSVPKAECHCACPPALWRKPREAGRSNPVNSVLSLRAERSNPPNSSEQGRLLRLSAAGGIPRNDSVELQSIRTEIGDCKRCKLCKGRNNIVFGVGNPSAALMFIGEGPGADEDAKGEPFVGRAGQLLTKIIEVMGLKRGDVYISNIVMCRPPNNRNPEPDEIEECMPFLLKRISVIKPKIIVTLGAIATKAMLATEVPISKIRGKFLDWPSEALSPSLSKEGSSASPPLLKGGEGGFELPPCKLLPTYHPAFLLRNPAMKRPVWEDMQKVMKELGI